MSLPASLQGEVADISDRETIVTVWVRRPEGYAEPINFDHRMFAHLFAAEGDLRGRTVKYDYAEGVMEVLD